MNDTIVILANSIKHGLRCVAGKSVTTGKWVRLVANVEGGAVTNDQASYTNKYGFFVAKPMQKIIMNIARPVPLINQPENVLVESGWTQNFNIGLDDLPQYQDYPESLWGNGKRIDGTEIVSGEYVVGQSLYLVKVESLTLFRSGEKKRRVTFKYGMVNYDLPATCTNFDSVESGESQHNNWVVVSLGEAHTDGYHYKIVATIL